MREVNAKEFKKAMIEADCDTYGQLSELCGISRTILGQYVAGDQKPSYDSIVKLADAMGLTYEDIGIIFFSVPITELQQE